MRKGNLCAPKQQLSPEPVGARGIIKRFTCRVAPEVVKHHNHHTPPEAKAAGAGKKGKKGGKVDEEDDDSDDEEKTFAETFRQSARLSRPGEPEMDKDKDYISEAADRLLDKVPVRTRL